MEKVGKKEQIQLQIMQAPNITPPANSIVFSYPWLVYPLFTDVLIVLALMK